MGGFTGGSEPLNECPSRALDASNRYKASEETLLSVGISNASETERINKHYLRSFHGWPWVEPEGLTCEVPSHRLRAQICAAFALTGTL